MKVAAFVDESFDAFFNLSKNNGYFCMGVLIVPEEVIWDFNKVFLGYRKSLAQALNIRDDGLITSELKSTKLRTLSREVRIALLQPFLNWAKNKEIAVGGFYTTTEGYVNYNVRNEAVSGMMGISDLQDPERIKKAREDILARRASEHAESLIIGDIAQVISGMLLHYCGERDMSFTLHYDPRNELEDQKVFERIDAILKPLENVLLERTGVYLGCDNSNRSNDSAGIQMVDHLTRDLRSLFQSHPALLTQRASSSLVTSEIKDPNNTIATNIGGRIFKWGERFPIEQPLQEAIFSSQSKVNISDYQQILMAKRLSCYSQSGEARIVNFEDFYFETMVD